MFSRYDLGRFDDRRRAVLDATAQGPRTLARICADLSATAPAARERVRRTTAYLARHGVLVPAEGVTCRRRDGALVQAHDLVGRLADLAPHEAAGLVRQPEVTVARFLSGRNVGTGLRRFMSANPEAFASWTVVDARRDAARFEAEIDVLDERGRGFARAALRVTRSYVAVSGAFSTRDLAAAVGPVVRSATGNVRLGNAVLNGAFEGVDLAGFLADPTRLWSNGIEPMTQMGQEAAGILKAHMASVAIEEDAETASSPSWCREDIVPERETLARFTDSSWANLVVDRSDGRTLR